MDPFSGDNEYPKEEGFGDATPVRVCPSMVARLAIRGVPLFRSPLSSWNSLAAPAFPLALILISAGLCVAPGLLVTVLFWGGCEVARDSSALAGYYFSWYALWFLRFSGANVFLFLWSVASLGGSHVTTWFSPAVLGAARRTVYFAALPQALLACAGGMLTMGLSHYSCGHNIPYGVWILGNALGLMGSVLRPATVFRSLQLEGAHVSSWKCAVGAFGCLDSWMFIWIGYDFWRHII